MRIIPFPGQPHTAHDERWLAELEAALDGDAQGPAAESWRQLREDVRVLATPMSPGFERELSERIAERSGLRRRGQRIHAFAAAVATTGVAVVVLVIAGFGTGGTSSAPPKQAAPAQLKAPLLSSAPAGTLPSSKSAVKAAGAERGSDLQAAPSNGAAAASSQSSAPTAASAGPAAAAGRVQQLAASISLAADPSAVQETADRVAQLAVREGGFVQSSHVQVQQAGTSEANLALKLPSAKLGAALASLAQLAPVRGESQALQDITDTYDAALRRLADANAERLALLRALGRATSEGQIDSLRERIRQANGAIAEAGSALRAVSQRASSAEVEVTVIGAAAASEGLTLHRGLHDAGRVLTVTLVVLLIAAAILVPLALLLAAGTAGRHALRRYRRERALDAR